jgi:hypothetical protein
MQQKNDAQQPQINLNCCQGKPAPQPVVDGWKQFIRFPEKARNGFMGLLASTLMEPANPANKQRLESFCDEHGLAEQDVVAAVRTCDFLLRQASALDLDASVFQQDLVLLSGGVQQYAETIISQYGGAKADLRKILVQESLADHGKVLVGIDWRMDSVSASNRGAKLNTPVIILTLRYRENNRIKRTTLQLTPDAIKELKLFTDRFSRDGGQPA